MKTPPLLLGVALLFWGWQSGLLIAGAVMAVVLESSRFIKARWEFSDDDFKRIWTFCALLFFAVAIYAFTTNEGPANWRGLFQHPTLAAERGASVSSARTAAALFRWLPMTLFLFVAAQAFSSREEIPLTAISQILRRRWKKAHVPGQPPPTVRGVNVSYPYFGICLFSASIHTSENNTFFLGLCALLVWALWSQRPRRFGVGVWAAAVVIAFALGYSSQYGLGNLQRIVESLNPQWLSRFARRGFDPARNQTQLGRIGRLKASGKIVIRLEPEAGNAPNYLREASYRVYRSTVWRDTDLKDAKTLDTINHATNETTWVLVPGKTNVARASIACYFEDQSPSGGRVGWLPLPEGCGELDNLPAFGLEKNQLGAVLAEGPGLVVFDACFGPGETIDSPATNEDLAVPAREISALDQVIPELRLGGTNFNDKLRSVGGFFQSKFSYSTWQPVPRITSTNETPLSRFLLQTRSGHCEYFATATVLLLRRLHVQSRYAVGYFVHETSGRGYVVRLRDAHAWCLVWNPDRKIWQDFDTTPGSWVEVEGRRASPLQWLSDFWSRVRFELSKFRWGQSQFRQYLLMALVPVLALLLYQIFFRKRRRGRAGKTKAAATAIAWPGLDSEFYQIETQLAGRGLPRRANEPLSAWLQRAAADPALSGLTDPLRELLRLHYRYRFDPQGLGQFDRDQLKRGVAVCLEKLGAQKQAAIHAAISARVGP